MYTTGLVVLHYAALEFIQGNAIFMDNLRLLEKEFDTRIYEHGCCGGRMHYRLSFSINWHTSVNQTVTSNLIWTRSHCSTQSPPFHLFCTRPLRAAFVVFVVVAVAAVAVVKVVAVVSVVDVVVVVVGVVVVAVVVVVIVVVAVAVVVVVAIVVVVNIVVVLVIGLSRARRLSKSASGTPWIGRRLSESCQQFSLPH